ncbi:MAG: methyltransferase domain-containing protein [Planctomycetota bacterium]
MLPKLKERLLLPERMDDPTLVESEHIHALRGLRRLNCWTGNAKAAWSPIRDLAATQATQPLTLLDVATGAGDVPCRLLRYALSSGVPLEVHACDASRRALDFARHSFPTESTIRLFQLDVVAEPIPNRYDVVMCTTFLHHLSRDDALVTLRKMRNAARKRVVVVDLERAAVNWLQVWLGCQLLTRSRVVHFDGPQSVRAAFTMDEIWRLANHAGFSALRIHRQWPCRFVLVGDV